MFWESSRQQTPHHLPLPEGQYATGCIDLMTGYGIQSNYFRLFYPTDVPSTAIKKYCKRWVRWKASEAELKGMAKFLKMWTFFLRLIIWIFGKDTYVPTIWDEALSTKVKKMPLVIFSHGYGATRYLCSTVCNELASRGCLVACIEHKDHSACVTHYYESEEHFKRDEKSYVWVDPHHHKISYSTANYQLKQRSQQCKRLLDWFEAANNGNGTNIIDTKFDVNMLKDRLDLSGTTIMGHSFGGATGMYTLSKDDRFKTGIILDGWMFPIKEESLEIRQPLLLINSQTFNVKSNIEMMKKYAQKNSNIVVYTMRGTTHESHTDTAVIYGYWLNKFMKKTSARTALRIQNNLILDFLRKNIDIDIDENATDGYLKEQSHNIVPDFMLHSTSNIIKVGIF